MRHGGLMLGKLQKVDELGKRLIKIKALKKECEELEAELKAQYGSQLQEKNQEVAVKGHEYILTFKKGERVTLDGKAIREAFGEAVLPFERVTEFVSVKANEI
jgi:hypothetical protein